MDVGELDGVRVIVSLNLFEPVRRSRGLFQNSEERRVLSSSSGQIKFLRLDPRSVSESFLRSGLLKVWRWSGKSRVKEVPDRNEW